MKEFKKEKRIKESDTEKRKNKVAGVKKDGKKERNKERKKEKLRKKNDKRGKIIK